MEETEITHLWQKYRLLESRKELTPLVIKQFIAKKSTDDLRLMTVTMYASLFVYAGLSIVFLIALELYGTDIRYMLVSIGGAILSCIGLSWTILLLRKLRSVKFSSSALTEVRSLIEQLRRLLRVEVYSLFIFLPLLLACLLPVIYMMMQQLNLFQEFAQLAPRVLLTYVLIVVISLWMYRKYHFKTLKLFEKRMEIYISLKEENEKPL